MMKRSLFGALGAALLGMMVYYISHNYLFMIVPKTKPFSISDRACKPLVVSLYYATKPHDYQIDKVTILPDSFFSTTLTQIMRAWLQAHDTPVTIDIQRCAVSDDLADLFIHFSHNPFNKQWSMHSKLLWLQGLLYTIHMFELKIVNVYFFVGDLPLNDYELDFSHAWPVEGFLN